VGKCQDTYYDPIVIQDGNCTIRIHRPILDDAERERRMKRIRKSAANLVQECIRANGPQWLEEFMQGKEAAHHERESGKNFCPAR
jgi:hypothetical protein